MIGRLGIGDVVAVNTGDHIFAWLIRAGEALEAKPHDANHVVIVHHQDARGTWWGIEGRPGGVGYVDMNLYLDSPFSQYANANATQPRTDAQRAAIAVAAQGMLGVGYDWIGGIGADTMAALHLEDLAGALDRWWGWTDPQNATTRPAHVVCSSLAAWVYAHLGLDHPQLPDEELCTPADWWAFNHELTQGASVG